MVVLLSLVASIPYEPQRIPQENFHQLSSFIEYESLFAIHDGAAVRS